MTTGAQAATAAAWHDAWSPADGARRARELFARAFGEDPAGPPAGVWSAPGRVNLIGEHTDYNAGLCLPTALPHRTYVALRPRPDGVVRLASAQADGLWEADLDDMDPAVGTTPGWGAYLAGVAWALRQAGHGVGGFDAAVDSCVPFGASLSSSAALESAVAVALDDVHGLGLGGTIAGRSRLVAACVRAENDVAGAATGGLDQSVSLLCRAGEALLLDFRPGLAPEEHAVRLPWDLAGAGLTLLAVDTRAPHQLVDGQYAARRASCERAAALLGLGSLREVVPGSLDDALAALVPHDPDGVLRRRVRHVVTETARTAHVAELVRAGAYVEVGPLMTASHASLRDDFEVTVPELDLAVAASLAAGALGARMTGGGFGGSTLALVRAGDVDAVVAEVAAAFAAAGLAAPAFLLAPPSAPAGRTD
ncbi:galactokinase [Krasilnikoviella flava]|uniref:Galactokinase n=1 Tax=Krasilnikoviella flava TaxID=526729 RepID=A0A1T5KAY0_9MICO|nr:galactokinase [Krasilnikoviella flava]SKC60659.1 galactokinase [Krasilnikoviella flava]